MARARPYKLTAPRVPEHLLQKQIVSTLRLELSAPGAVSDHGVVWWSVDAANTGDEVPGIRQGRGIIAGVPDMLFLYRGEAFLIEIKAADGVLTAPQKSVLANLLAASIRVGVARDAFEVLKCLDGWGVPRRRRVREAA